MSTQITAMERVSARISFLVILTCVFILLSISKLAGIQIMHHEEYLQRA